MAVVYFSPIFNGYQSFLASGLPNNSGFIYTYQAGTSTPLATYTSVTGNVANANPITLNSSGFPVASGNITEIWLNSASSYKFVVTDALLNILGTYDNVPGIAGNVSFFFTIGQTAVTTTLGQTVIPLTFTYSTGSNSIQVYRNGAKQVISTDYTETSSTSVTLIVSALKGELIEVMGTIVGSGGVGTVTHTAGNLTANALVVGNAAADITVLSSLGTATTVLHGNATGLPSFGAVSLSTDVTGTLLAAQMPTLTANAFLTGGGATTLPNAVALTGIVVGNGASAPSAVTAPAGTIVGTTDTQALTGKTYNGLTISTTTGTITLTNAKTLSVTNALTFSGTDSTTMTFPPASASIGYLNIPQNSQSAAYTTVLADSGKHIYHPVGDATPRTFTIDSNANVAYAVGTAITFINRSASAVTISITADTLTWSPTGSTGSRTLAQYGQATAIKITTTEWLISGTGLS